MYLLLDHPGVTQSVWCCAYRLKDSIQLRHMLSQRGSDSIKDEYIYFIQQ